MRQTSTAVNATPAKCTSPEKVVKLFYPEYLLHTDTELEQVRQQLTLLFRGFVYKTEQLIKADV